MCRTCFEEVSPLVTKHCLPQLVALPELIPLDFGEAMAQRLQHLIFLSLASSSVANERGTTFLLALSVGLFLRCFGCVANSPATATDWVAKVVAEERSVDIARGEKAPSAPLLTTPSCAPRFRSFDLAARSSGSSNSDVDAG